MAPCAGGISAEHYRNIVAGVIDFLKGNDKNVKSILEQRMKIASDNADFELAIFYRDRLKMLEKLIRQQISALPRDFNLDIFSAVDNGIMTVVTVLIARGGKLLGGDNFPLTTELTVQDMPRVSGEAKLGGLDNSSLKREELKGTLTQFILQYYQKNPSFPDEIVINESLDDKAALETVLSEMSGKKVNILRPVQGVRKQLVNMAENNAVDYQNNFISKSMKKDSLTRGAVTMLAENLGLRTLPERMECYDISHISGTNMVASMVVFIGGEPAKSHYRRFKIKTVEGNNDFACMQEALLRRLTRLSERDCDNSFGSRPDLIVVDGGKGQLGYALEALSATHNEDIEIVSLAKREEEVYVPHSGQPIILDRNSVSLKLLQRLRDEAHRFAVTYHKQLRANAQTVSELSKIEGIGSKKINTLYQNFKSLAKIKAATVEELSAVKGISARDANAIFGAYHKK
jgi:excinuclease ABC subunit C